jgi:hypothetical protein
LFALLTGCSDRTDTSSGGGSEGAGGGQGAGGSTLPSQVEACRTYLDCLAEVTPIAVPEALDAYGPDGSCWVDDNTAATCEASCIAGAEQLRELYPDAVACGTAACVPGPSELDADFFLTLSTQLSPDEPFVFTAHATSPTIGAQTGLVLNIQPRAAADRRTPVGTALQAGPVPIDAAGSFSIDFGQVQIPAAANPISNLPVTTTVVLTGSLCGGDFWCGEATGDVSQPVPTSIDGSTWTMQRVTDLNAVPPAYKNCDKEVAP